MPWVSNMTIMSVHVQSVHSFYFWSYICHWKWIQRHWFPIWRGHFSCPMLRFVYFGDFSLCMRNFDHTTTSRLKSNVIFEFSAAISYTDTIISGARHHVWWLLWRQCMRMCSKCINSTSGRKFVTRNWFSDTDFLYDGEILAIWCCFSTSGLKSDVIFEFNAPLFLWRWDHFRCTTPFSATFVTIISAHEQYMH